MSPEPATRDKSILLPEWWLVRVRELVDERGENMTQIGIALAAQIGRDEIWDHSAVSRFLNNKVTTQPMAEAFAQLLGLPRPFYLARTLDEAIALQAVALRYDPKPASSRLSAVDQVAETLEAEARDQSRGVASVDERSGRRGRAGRAHRSRP
jgi:hypothetical protein